MMLDVQYGSRSPGARVIQWPLDYGANQLWNSEPGTAFNDGHPDFGLMINQNSGQCLSTDGNPGDPVFQLPSQGSPWQRWAISSSLGGGFNIQSMYDFDLPDVYQYSYSPGAPIDTWQSKPPEGDDFNQVFNVIPAAS
jgi:Ricin-type beta-trefoil lectin domain-like